MRTLIRAVAVGLAMVMLAIPVSPELLFTSKAVNDVASSVALEEGTTDVTIRNKGTETVYFRIFRNCDTAGDATVNSNPIEPGEPMEIMMMPTEQTGRCYGSWYSSLSVIAAPTKSSTLRVYRK